MSYSFINTSKKGLYVSEKPENAIKFLQQVGNVPILIKNDKGEVIEISEIKDVYVSILITGKIQKKELETEAKK